MFENASISKVQRSFADEFVITEIARVGLIAVGVIAAFVAAIRMKQKISRPKRRLLDRRKIRSHRAEQMHRTRQMLGRAIVGNSQNAILTIFGPPRSSAGYSAMTSPNVNDAFLQANTWYYVLDHADRRAMVIEFEDGIARSAQFIGGVATR